MEIDTNSREKLIAALEQAGKSQLRKKKARLREIYDAVLLAKSQDLGEKTIMQLLSDKGLHFESRSAFAVTMHRIKKDIEKEVPNVLARPHHVGAAIPATIEVGKRDSAVIEKLIPVAEPVSNTSSKRKHIFKEDKSLFKDLKPSPADGVVDLKQK